MTNRSKKEQIKKPRGLSVKNIIEPIDATLEKIVSAICLAAEKKLEEKRRIKI